jgi:CBS domain-containing protein
MFRAKDIMSSDVITVTTDTPIYEAMRLLAVKGISGLPVVDNSMNLAGIISEKDMLHILIDGDIQTKQTVSDYMNRKVASFSQDDDVLDICDFFIKSTFRRVPIVQDGKLTGIISRHDIIKLILKLRAKAQG